MTIVGRFGGWLLLIFGLALTAFGLVGERDVVVLAGALVAASGVVLDRLRAVEKPESPVAAAKAQMRRDVEERIAERLRQSRHN